MQLNYDLVREIMLALEAKPVYGEVLNRDIIIPNHSTEEVAYHCELLYEKKFISSYESKCNGNRVIFFKVGDLTWAGHEYLETVREKTRWEKIKKVISDKGEPLLVETVKTVSNVLIQKALVG